MNTSKNKNMEASMTSLMHKIGEITDWMVTGHFQLVSKPRSDGWPVLPGSYKVGDPFAPVAVCTLTSNKLFAPLSTRPGVAIAGRGYSANLGLEKIIMNITAKPSIRFLLICGKESTYFQLGQAISALFSHGVTSEGRIIQANGHLPVVSHIDISRIDQFRKQVQLVDCTGEEDLDKVTAVIQELAEHYPGPYQGITKRDDAVAIQNSNGNGFKPIRLGGHRESLAYDPNGFFVITVDRTTGNILVHHYLSDNTPAHVVQGRHGESILLALLREELISQKSHAGYLGAELAKAETAVRLDLPYEQDQPLRLR